MASIFTSYTDQEFKALLKDILTEILDCQVQQNPLPEIMDIQEAAKFLKLEVNTLYEKTSKRLIPHFKKGNKLYFVPAQLLDWVFSGKVKTKDEVQAEAQIYSLNNRHDKAA